MNCMLDATQSKRPAGLVMDKMTPNSHTGQIHAINFHIMAWLCQPDKYSTMLDYLIINMKAQAAMVNTSKKVLRINQLKMLEISDMTDEEKIDWVMEVWELAHQIELVT